MGKILRVRLSTDPNATGYTIPGDNMHAEIWAYGFRYLTLLSIVSSNTISDVCEHCTEFVLAVSVCFTMLYCLQLLPLRRCSAQRTTSHIFPLPHTAEQEPIQVHI